MTGSKFVIGLTMAVLEYSLLILLAPVWVPRWAYRKLTARKVVNKTRRPIYSYHRENCKREYCWCMYDEQ
jgi:hypothetical protein